MRTSTFQLFLPALLLVSAAPASATPGALPSLFAQSATASASSDQLFGPEELEQMVAQIALYPDSLLAQILMASTYPGDVADAAAWSKAHKDAKGEDAVKQVESQPWDPSVQSLVAFPQVLDVLGQDPAWVQKLGDAFLAQPDDVMAAMQRLRSKAQAAGNLKSTEQQTVTAGPAMGGTTTVDAPPQTIIIESADPEVVYVPNYDPTVVYGAWGYPSYPPYYYPPSPYYYPGGGLFAFGVGVAVGGALWGDVNWGSGDIDIDVDNNFNSNRNVNRGDREGNRGDRQANRGDRQANRGDNKFRHNSANRDGVPYRDSRNREQNGRQREGAAQRDAYRGRDQARNADRARASQSMANKGFDRPAATNREARDRAGQASRQMGQGGAQGRTQGRTSDFDRGQQQLSNQRNAQARNSQRQQATRSQGGARNNDAFSGSRNPGQSRASSSRGRSSYGSSQRGGSRGAGRSMSRPSRGGGGGRRR
ncbi:DUF3300 domain-containing protein [Agrilutibacter solisilvae]|uniref:DUF3300 domain-containing protein n=1 Tax=Agrilutibacter solisilvae TaxID=2763317 RepID=A0A974Y274_9GAMM|nr:DUF3300 domain-containing protein [Lysobacter solisilvae]QSX79188.1 DUF3300 domain-containing protein [Lysobacter solisilvae]